MQLKSEKLAAVRILQGTDSSHDFSTGNSLPLVALPWGLNHWSLQTAHAPWTFQAKARKLWGIRLTHQPSPWMRDYASLMLAPFHGTYYDEAERQASAYRQSDAVLAPCYLETEFLRYGIKVKMAPSNQGAVFEFTTESSEPMRLRFDFDGPFALETSPGNRRLTGRTSDQFEGENLRNFGLHFVGEFDVPVADFCRTANGGYVEFPKDERKIILRFSSSFISQPMAELSLKREIGSAHVDEICERGETLWDSLLNRIEIEAESETQKTIFYSCLYRCLLFPRFFDEFDETGKVVHYSPHDGEVHAGSLCADTGFWDTFRTLYPLLTLVYPDVVTKMMHGWLNACRESGWTPKWASPGARDCMIGTHFDVVAADLVAKGLTDWDVEGSFQFLWKDATIPGKCGRYGRRGLEEYLQLGYVAADKTNYSVSATLDFCYDDFCVAQVARFLGRCEEEQLLLARAQNYRNLFDPSVGFMRPRNSDGSWVGEFREFSWGGPYIEGGPWQHSLNVPHDVEGLASLFGGPRGLVEKLDLMLATPPRFEVGAYPFEIHEMTEMAVASFGQYAHSNQPVHNFLFLFALAGEPRKTEYWVSRVLKEYYTPETFPGDEDNGEMAAWYVWASLGLFPVCPGKAEYLRFQPAVRSAELRIPGVFGVVRIGAAAEAGMISHQELLKR